MAVFDYPATFECAAQIERHCRRIAKDMERRRRTRKEVDASLRERADGKAIDELLLARRQALHRKLEDAIQEKMLRVYNRLKREYATVPPSQIFSIKDNEKRAAREN